MIRPLILSAALALSACKSSPPGLSTIEEGEAYAQAHGVALADRTERAGVAVAQRAYGFKANGAVTLNVLQFGSDAGAEAWKKGMDDMPSGEIVIRKGAIAFSVWGGTDTDRQKVVDALK